MAEVPADFVGLLPSVTICGQKKTGFYKPSAGGGMTNALIRETLTESIFWHWDVNTRRIARLLAAKRRRLWLRQLPRLHAISGLGMTTERIGRLSLGTHCLRQHPQTP